MRVECKCTGADSFRVTRDMLDKLVAAAFGTDELPVLQVELLGDGKPGSLKRLYVMPDWAVEDMLERLTGGSATLPR